MSNLKLVQRLHKEAVERGDQVDELGPFEVTQLVNSFSGALAHPWERVFATDRQFSSPGAENILRIARHFEVTLGSTETIGELITMFRHAFAHGNIEFLGNPDIEKLRLWNCGPKPGRPRGSRATFKNWEVIVSIHDIERLLKAFVSFAATLDRLDSQDWDDCHADD